MKGKQRGAAGMTYAIMVGLVAVAAISAVAAAGGSAKTLLFKASNIIAGGGAVAANTSAPPPPPPSCTAGAQLFTAIGTTSFDPTITAPNCTSFHVLVIGGGGAGGSGFAGSGGGSGNVAATTYTYGGSGSFSITVGRGGLYNDGTATNQNGVASSFSVISPSYTLTAAGGVRGLGGDNAQGGVGGSAGGSKYSGYYGGRGGSNGGAGTECNLSFHANCGGHTTPASGQGAFPISGFTLATVTAPTTTQNTTLNYEGGGGGAGVCINGCSVNAQGGVNSARRHQPWRARLWRRRRWVASV